MTTTDAIRRGAVRAEDLAEVVALPGPFVSLYLNTESRIENAAQRAELRWKTARRALEDVGASAVALGAIDPWVAEAHTHGDTLAAFATGEGVAHVEHGPAPLPLDVWRWAPLPSLARVLAWRQAAPPYVTVLADRRGADIVAVRRERPPIVLETEGEDYPLRKVQAGGWSHRRYQQRAENTWEHNARNVATEIARVVERVDARIVVVAGDVRALELIREDVPKEIAEKLHEVRGGRSEDGSTEAFEDAVDEAVVALVRRDKESLLDAFQQELGQHDRAVQGADRTLRALSMSQVEVLFVREELEPERTAWFGPDASRVALDRATLRELGIESATEATLVDVAIRAALGTGAGVLVLPADEGPDEGIGALLRWSAQR